MIHWIRKWQLTPEFLTRKFYGQRNLMGYSPLGCKSWTGLSMYAHIYDLHDGYYKLQ